jgi:hypothetical protein
MQRQSAPGWRRSVCDFIDRISRNFLAERATPSSVSPKIARDTESRSACDVTTALSLKWCTNRVDHLVVKYESEWGGQMSKWDALDPFMHDGLPYWKAEKERIERLQMRIRVRLHGSRCPRRAFITCIRSDW